MATESELNFDTADLAPRSIPVKLPGGGRYRLTEASEDGAVKYQNLLMKSTRMSDGKVVGVTDMADAEPQLVADCLQQELTTKAGDLQYGKVAVGFVRGLPARVVRKMYDWVRANSDLGNGGDPVGAALRDALSRDDSPITLGAFRDYCESLRTADPMKYSALKPLLAADGEAAAEGKGPPPPTGDTSP